MGEDTVFSYEDLQAIGSTAIDAGLFGKRTALLRGIAKDIIANINNGDSPQEQLRNDLDALNEILDYGFQTLPIVTWLENAARECSSKPPKKKTFERNAEKAKKKHLEQQIKKGALTTLQEPPLKLVRLPLINPLLKFVTNIFRPVYIENTAPLNDNGKKIISLINRDAHRDNITDYLEKHGNFGKPVAFIIPCLDEDLPSYFFERMVRDELPQIANDFHLTNDEDIIIEPIRDVDWPERSNVCAMFNPVLSQLYRDCDEYQTTASLTPEALIDALSDIHHNYALEYLICKDTWNEKRFDKWIKFIYSEWPSSIHGVFASIFIFLDAKQVKIVREKYSEIISDVEDGFSVSSNICIIQQLSHIKMRDIRRWKRVVKSRCENLIKSMSEINSAEELLFGTDATPRSLNELHPKLKQIAIAATDSKFKVEK